MREEGRLRVFEKRVLRKIFGPKRDEVIGEWRKNYIMWDLIICVKKIKLHACTGTEALYRPYSPYGE